MIWQGTLDQKSVQTTTYFAIKTIMNDQIKRHVQIREQRAKIIKINN